MIGSIGEMLDDSDAEGWARIHSEQWRVRSTAPLERGQRVRVTARKELLLTVVPVDDQGLGDRS